MRTRTRRPFAARYFLASVALLVTLVASYALTTARRTQAHLRGQLEQKAVALADVVEASSRNAIRSNALLEEMIARRLFDNARLVDELLELSDPAGLDDVARRNGLERIDLLDRDGRPWRPEPPRHPAMMRGMMQRGRGMHAGEPPPMMRYMWGRRWLAQEDGAADRPRPPAASGERRFWEGSSFGVAIGARSFPGIIAIHAGAREVLEFRTAVGVERQIAELGRQPGVSSVALLRPDLTVVAHSDPSRIGERVDDPVLSRLASLGGGSRLLDGAPGLRTFEVVRPLTLPGASESVLAIRFSTEPMERAWRADVRAGIVLGAGVLLAGALGLALIFYMEHRHLGDVRRLETELARGERLAAVGDVAAAFAHEVRNPLNAVSIGLQRLGAEFAAEPADEYGRFVTLMQGEVRRLNVTVEQFLALAKPLAVRAASVVPGELLRELAALLGAEAKAAGVELRLAVAPGLAPIVADRDRVREALLNLLRNGLHAMPDGGVLTLGAGAERDRVVLSVADTGPGVAADVLPRIFDPYFTTKPDGVGLGLAITRRIAEAHGGSIDVETSPGRGACFRLRLPRRPR